MACPRCGGLLVPNNEMVTGIYEEKAWLSFQGFRCVNCGFVDDPVIRTNRMSYILAIPSTGSLPLDQLPEVTSISSGGLS